MPLSLLLAIALVIGMLLASLYFFSQTLKLKWQLKRHEKANKKQLDEIIQLKKQMLELQTQKNDSDKKLLSLETTEQ
ncbi:LapA family protein [Hydrogenovibrio crunogenus]|nr:LapA family protein [Hydrogenovibrio crunogenus]